MAFPEQDQKRAREREKAQEIRRLLEGLTETFKSMVAFEREEVSQDQLVILSKVIILIYTY